MNFFSDLFLTRFRNYNQEHFAFNKRIIGIYGKNGVGKTNLLDSLYYLCFTKSYFNKSDAKSVRHGSAGFRIEGRMTDGTSITAILRETGKKEFSVDGEAYKKFSAHVGKYPCVMVAPDDVQLILGGGEERRRWLDAIIAQADSSYMVTLISYGKVLQQRNSLLKKASEQHLAPDELVLSALDEQMVSYGTVIFQKRELFFATLIPQVLKQNQMISGHRDDLQMKYTSQLHASDSFASQLAAERKKDILLQRTGIGIHKDDVLFLLDGQPFKNLASQGQRKSLLFSLKLSEYVYLKQTLHTFPFLLLDDIFEKLDETRMNSLLHFIMENTENQVFITDTHKERLQEAFEKIGVDYQLLGL